MDFRKAFDSVPHERLLIKLAEYGVKGKVHDWIRNFLSNRQQRVRVGREYSDWESVLSGIPQGSILGPILFTVFINDLPDGLLSICKIFADDTKLYNNAENHVALQHDLDYLSDWSEKWKLFFNIQKCKVLHMGKENSNHEYRMVNGDVQKVLANCDQEKDLGVTFDNNLLFDTHIQKAVNKANQMLGLIKRAFDFINKDVFIKLYKAFVRPHLEYGNIIWHPFLKRQSVAIEKVQRRATKLLYECKDMPYPDRLKYLNIYSLKGRRLRGDLIETYKIANKLTDIEFKELFTLTHTDKTRKFEGKLVLEHCKTNIRKNFLSQRIVHHWNSLPEHYKFADSTNMFKNLLDQEWKESEIFFDFDD